MHFATKEIKLESLNRLSQMIGENAMLPLSVVGREDRGLVSVENARKALHKESYEYEAVDGRKLMFYFTTVNVTLNY